MQYTFTEQIIDDEGKPTGETREIDAVLEKWAWVAYYKDGSSLAQFDGGGRFHQMKEIDWEQLSIFSVYRTEEGSNHKCYDIMVQPNMQVFFFHRNQVLEYGTERERRFRFPVFGWKDRETDAKHYHYILPNDTMVIGDRDLMITFPE